MGMSLTLGAAGAALSTPAPVPMVSGVVVDPADILSTGGKELVDDPSSVRSGDGGDTEAELGLPDCFLSCCWNFSMA